MKNIILTILVILFINLKGYCGGAPLCASTGNDLCSNAILLTVNVLCSGGCTEGAGVEGGETFNCASGNKSIWYKFVATSINHQVNIWQLASNGCFNGSVIWSGGCLPSIAISCHDAPFGPLNQAHLLTGLIIGNTYLIQVLYNSGGPCGSNANVCVEVITYDPCDLSGGCTDVCYAACEFISSPLVSDVTCCCPSMSYNPPMHERSRKECYSFTANSSITTFSAIVSSNCSGGQFTQLNWTLYNSSCTIIEGPINIFVDNTGTTIAGNTYKVCYDMIFAECNITQLWVYVVVGGVLPIELLYFKGKLIENNNIFLEWVTLSEINNDYFTLEKSIDGFIFNELINIPGNGNTNKYINYDYIDCVPFKPITYYKLKQTDYDGQFSYSNIVGIKIDNNIYNKNYIYYNILGQKIDREFNQLSNGIYIRYDGYSYDRVFKN
mgnify:CR=1 FL=1